MQAKRITQSEFDDLMAQIDKIAGPYADDINIDYEENCDDIGAYIDTEIRIHINIEPED